MRIVIGKPERETRRGSYWTVDVTARSNEGEPWYSNVLAVAQGDTERAAINRAFYIAASFEKADAEQIARMEVQP